MSPGPVRLPVPAAVVGAVIALCALLLLKWLALVALAALGIVALARWAWNHRPRRGRVSRVPDDDAGPTPAPPDCSWCGLAGGHVDRHGRAVRSRHAHPALAAPRG